MNRAEYELISNRIAAVELRCELLEQENQRLKAAPLEAQVHAEIERSNKRAGNRVGA